MLRHADHDEWWASTYPRIVADLGLDTAADADAAFLLDRLLDTGPARRITTNDLDLPGPVLVAGAALRLESDLAAAPPQAGEHVVVADAALERVLPLGIPVALVVTDLDGDPATLERANADGIALAVHAHGDNQAALRAIVPRLSGPVLGTRQTTGMEPARLLVPGGFTDGDRAVLIAARLGATRIRLAGFDLTGPIGPGTVDPARKRRKMEWAARILDAARRHGVPLA